MGSISSRPLCDSPRGGIFCGTDKYLKLLKHRFSERSFPIIENDGYLLYVVSGGAVFIINGISFEVRAGCASWIQSTQVLSIEPLGGEPLEVWSVCYDYQLANYLLFSTPTTKQKRAVVFGSPIVWPGSDKVEQIRELFQLLEQMNCDSNYGSSLVKVSLIGQITLLFAQETELKGEQNDGWNWPLGWRACMYLAAHCVEPLRADEVARSLGSDAVTLNRELRMVTGQNFEQLLSRNRCILAASYFLYDSLPFDFIAIQSGFMSEVTFYRCFKKNMGMTPKEYRDNMLCENDKNYRGLIMSETLLTVINHLYNNLTEHISVDSMAKSLFTSGSIIRSLLLDTFGLGYKDILSLFRIRYSESLLASTELPILDISVMVGFNSDRTYSRIFNNINKMSPSAYRLLCKKVRCEQL